MNSAHNVFEKSSVGIAWLDEDRWDSVRMDISEANGVIVVAEARRIEESGTKTSSEASTFVPKEMLDELGTTATALISESLSSYMGKTKASSAGVPRELAELMSQTVSGLDQLLIDSVTHGNNNVPAYRMGNVQPPALSTLSTTSSAPKKPNPQNVVSCISNNLEAIVYHNKTVHLSHRGASQQFLVTSKVRKLTTDHRLGGLVNDLGDLGDFIPKIQKRKLTFNEGDRLVILSAAAAPKSFPQKQLINWMGQGSPEKQAHNLSLALKKFGQDSGCVLVFAPKDIESATSPSEKDTGKKTATAPTTPPKSGKKSIASKDTPIRSIVPKGASKKSTQQKLIAQKDTAKKAAIKQSADVVSSPSIQSESNKTTTPPVARPSSIKMNVPASPIKNTIPPKGISQKTKRQKTKTMRAIVPVVPIQDTKPANSTSMPPKPPIRIHIEDRALSQKENPQVTDSQMHEFAEKVAGQISEQEKQLLIQEENPPKERLGFSDTQVIKFAEKVAVKISGQKKKEQVHQQKPRFSDTQVIRIAETVAGQMTGQMEAFKQNLLANVNNQLSGLQKDVSTTKDESEAGIPSDTPLASLSPKNEGAGTEWIKQRTPAPVSRILIPLIQNWKFFAVLLLVSVLFGVIGITIGHGCNELAEDTTEQAGKKDLTAQQEKKEVAKKKTASSSPPAPVPAPAPKTSKTQKTATSIELDTDSREFLYQKGLQKYLEADTGRTETREKLSKDQREKSFQEALPIFEDLVSQSPKNAQYWFLKARVEYSLTKYIKDNKRRHELAKQAWNSYNQFAKYAGRISRSKAKTMKRNRIRLIRIIR